MVFIHVIRRLNNQPQEGVKLRKLYQRQLLKRREAEKYDPIVIFIEMDKRKSQREIKQRRIFR